MSSTNSIIVIECAMFGEGWDVLTSENGYQFSSLGFVFPDEASALRVAKAIQRELPDCAIEVGSS